MTTDGVMSFDVIKDIDLLTLSGSHLYGLASPESDVDYLGVVIAPIAQKYNLARLTDDGKLVFHNARKSKQQMKLQNGVIRDTSIQTADKFIRLACAGNTHVKEALFAGSHPTGVHQATLFGHSLLEYRTVFVARKTIGAKFAGYARSEELKTLGAKTGNLGAARKKAIEQHGYSPKNAYHALRLYTEGEELLLTGLLRFPLHGAAVERIRAAKMGEASVTDITMWLNEAAKSFIVAFENSSLPDYPAVDDINALLIAAYWESEDREWQNSNVAENYLTHTGESVIL